VHEDVRRLVALAADNLPFIYAAQGRDAEAEPLVRRALAIGEKALGPDDQEVATMLTNLATICERTGRLSEAESLLKRVLAIREKEGQGRERSRSP